MIGTTLVGAVRGVATSSDDESRRRSYTPSVHAALPLAYAMPNDAPVSSVSTLSPSSLPRGDDGGSVPRKNPFARVAFTMAAVALFAFSAMPNAYAQGIGFSLVPVNPVTSGQLVTVGGNVTGIATGATVTVSVTGGPTCVGLSRSGSVYSTELTTTVTSGLTFLIQDFFVAGAAGNYTWAAEVNGFTTTQVLTISGTNVPYAIAFNTGAFSGVSASTLACGNGSTTITVYIVDRGGNLVSTSGSVTLQAPLGITFDVGATLDINSTTITITNGVGSVTIEDVQGATTADFSLSTTGSLLTNFAGFSGTCPIATVHTVTLTAGPDIVDLQMNDFVEPTCATVSGQIRPLDACGNIATTTGTFTAVTIGVEYGGVTIATATADAQGNFTFSVGTAGTYTVVATTLSATNGTTVLSTSQTVEVKVTRGSLASFTPTPSGNYPSTGVNAFAVNFLDNCNNALATSGTFTAQVTGPTGAPTVLAPALVNTYSTSTTLSAGAVATSTSGTLAYQFPVAGTYTFQFSTTGSGSTDAFTTSQVVAVDITNIGFVLSTSTCATGRSFTIELLNNGSPLGAPVNGNISWTLDRPTPLVDIDGQPVILAGSTNTSFSISLADVSAVGVYTLSAEYVTVTGTTLAASTTFSVSVSQIVFSTVSQVQTGTSATFTVGFRAADACGNILDATTGAATVTMTHPSFGTPVLAPTTVPFNTATVVTASSVTAGTYTLTATAGSYSTSTSITIDANHIVIEAATTSICTTSGFTFSYSFFDTQATRLPVATNATLNVDVDGPAPIVPTIFAVPATSSGVTTISVVLTTAGTYSLDVSYTNFNGSVVNSTTINYVLDFATLANLSVNSTNINIGIPTTASVAFLDNCANPIATSAVVSFSIAGQGYTTTGTSAVSNAVLVTSANVTFNNSTRGTYTLSATAANIGGMVISSTSITVEMQPTTLSTIPSGAYAQNGFLYLTTGTVGRNNGTPVTGSWNYTVTGANVVGSPINGTTTGVNNIIPGGLLLDVPFTGLIDGTTVTYTVTDQTASAYYGTTISTTETISPELNQLDLALSGNICTGSPISFVVNSFLDLSTIPGSYGRAPIAVTAGSVTFVSIVGPSYVGAGVSNTIAPTTSQTITTTTNFNGQYAGTYFASAATVNADGDLVTSGTVQIDYIPSIVWTNSTSDACAFATLPVNVELRNACSQPVLVTSGNITYTVTGPSYSVTNIVSLSTPGTSASASSFVLGLTSGTYTLTITHNSGVAGYASTSLTSTFNVSGLDVVVAENFPFIVTCNQVVVPAPRVEVRNQCGAVVPLNGLNVTMQIVPTGVSTDVRFNGATQATVALVNGVADFSNVVITGSVGVYNVQFSAPASGATSAFAQNAYGVGGVNPASGFNLTTGFPNSIAFNNQVQDACPSSNENISLKVIDLCGNTVQSQNNVISISLSTTNSLSGTVSANFASVATVNGLANFTGSIPYPVAGTYYLIATTASQTNASVIVSGVSNPIIYDADAVTVVATVGNDSCVTQVIPAVITFRDECGQPIIYTSTSVTVSVTGGASIAPMMLSTSNASSIAQNLTFTAATAGSYTVTVSGFGGLTTTFTVGVAVDRYAVLTPTAENVCVNGNVNFTVAAYDQCGAPVVNNETLTLSVNNGASYGVASISFAGATTATANGAIATTTAATYTITATGPHGSTTYSVQVPEDRIAATLTAQDCVGGSNVDVTLNMLDNCSNAINSNTTVNASINGGAVLTTNASVNFAGANSRSFELFYTTSTAGNYTVTFNGNDYLGNALGSTSVSFIHDATSIEFTLAPSTTCVNSIVDFAVAVKDACGNPINITTTFSVTLNGGATSAPAVIAFSNSATASGSFLINTNSLPGVYALTVAGTSQFSGQALVVTSPTFTVDAAEIEFATAPPATATCGTVTTVAVDFRDLCNNVVFTNQPVTLSIGSGAALNGNASVTVNAVNGVATFSNLEITGVIGNYTITATATTPQNGTAVSVSAPVTITFGTPTQLAYVANTADRTAGIAAVAPDVQVLDKCGNVVTTNAQQYQISINPFTVPGNEATAITVAPSNGLATNNGTADFSTFTMTRAGQYTLVATAVPLGSAPAITSTSSNVFVVNPAPATKLAFAVQPPTTVAVDAPFSAGTIEVRDQYDNVVNSTTTITLTVNNGTLLGTNVRNAAAGSREFDNMRIRATAGPNFTFTASATGLTQAVSNQFTVIPGAAAILAFESPYAFNETENSLGGEVLSPNVTVEVRDIANNLVNANEQITLGIESGPAGATITAGTLTVGTNVNGIATFTGVILDKVGSYRLSATPANNALVGATSGIINVSLGAPYKLVFTTQPPTQRVAGQSFDVAIAVTDKGGNLIPTDNLRPVTIAPVNGPSNWFTTQQSPKQTTFGQVIFFGNTLYTTGCYELQVSAAGLVNGTSTTICIIPADANATTSTIVANGSTTLKLENGSGATTTATVTYRDEYGNLTSTGTLQLAVSGTNGGQVNGSAAAAVTIGAGRAPAVTTTVNYVAGTALNCDLSQSKLLAIAGNGGQANSSVGYIVYPADAVASTSFVSNAAETVLAGATGSFTVNFRDSYNNCTTTGTVSTLVTTSNGGAIGTATTPIAASGAITRTGTYTAPTVLNNDPNADVNIVNVSGSAVASTGKTFTVTPRTALAANTTIAANGATALKLANNGSGTSATMTVTFRDEYGNLTTTGSVNLTLDGTNTGAVTPNTGVGTGRTLETALVTFVANNNLASSYGQTRTIAVTGSSPLSSVAYTIAPADANSNQSFVSTGTQTIVSGTSTNVFVNFRDTYGNHTETGSVALASTPQNGGNAGTIAASVSAVTRDRNVAYISNSVVVNAPNADVNLVNVTGTGVVTSGNTINVIPGAATAANSSIAPLTRTLTVGGRTGIFTVTKRDQYGNFTTNGTVGVQPSFNNSNGGSVVVTNDGTASTTGTITYTSGTLAIAPAYRFFGTINTGNIATEVTINQVADIANGIDITNAGSGPEVYTDAPPTIDGVKVNKLFPVSIRVIDAYGNTTNATVASTVSYAGANFQSGSFTIPVGASTAVATGVRPTVPSTTPVTVVFTPNNLASTTLNVGVVYDALSFVYSPTTKEFTRFQPSADLNPVVNGGRAPFTFEVLEDNLFFNDANIGGGSITFSTSDGTITGVPTSVVAPRLVIARVVDAYGDFDFADVTLSVNQALVITYVPAVQNLITGQSYMINPTRLGGTNPVQYVVEAGTLPSGLSINASTGVISGTPNVTTASTIVTIRATDVNGSTDDASIEFVIVTQGTLPTALNAKVALEGPRNTSTTGTIMNTLNNGYISTESPFDGAVATIVPNNVVDWVQVQLRATFNGPVVTSASAFLLNDGRIVALNGSSQVQFDATGIPAGNYFVVVRSRNHLDVQSAVTTPLTAGTSTQYDFTDAVTKAYGTNALKNVNGVWSMFSGDADGNGVVNAIDRTQIRNNLFQVGYLTTDVNLDGVVNALDRVQARNNVFQVSQIP